MSRAVVLALHGFNDYRRAFAEVGPFLAARNVITYAYDQRGFGATDQRGIWPGTDLLVDDARTVAALLRERHPSNGYHFLTRDFGAKVVLEDLAAWLAEPTAPLPSGHEADRVLTLCGGDTVGKQQ